MNFNNIKISLELNKREKLLFFILIFIIFEILQYHLVYEDKINDIELIKNRKTAINREIKEYKQKINSLNKMKKKKCSNNCSIVRKDSNETVFNNLESIFLNNISKESNSFKYKLSDYSLAQLYKVNDKYNFTNLDIFDNGSYLSGIIEIYSEISNSEKEIENHNKKKLKSTNLKNDISINKKSDKKIESIKTKQITNKKIKQITDKDIEDKKEEYLLLKNEYDKLNYARDNIYNSSFYLNILKMNTNNESCNITYHETLKGDKNHYIMIEPLNIKDLILDLYIPGNISRVSFEIYNFEKSYSNLMIEDEKGYRNLSDVKLEQWQKIEFSEIVNLKKIIFSDIKENTAFYIRNFKVEI